MPTRKEKREIREKIEKLGEIDPDSPEAKQTIAEIQEMFELYGVADNSEFRIRLAEYLGWSSGPDFDQGERSYAGMSGNVKMIITPVYDHFFLQRLYKKHGRLKVSWRFNQEGRLELVDAMIFPGKKVTHVISVDNIGGDPEWDVSGGRYNLIDELDTLNPGFAGLDQRRKLESLLRFGQGDARDLFENLQRQNVRAPYNLHDDQESLADIVRDNAAIYMIEGASMLMPSVRVLSRERLEISY